MNIEKVDQFRLFKEDLSDFNYNNDYWLDSLSIERVYSERDTIEKIISYIKEDVLWWKNVPTFDEVIERAEFGSQCHLWMYKDNAIGWSWSNSSCITLDWKSHYKYLLSNELYVGGAFVSRKNKPSAGSALYFYRQGIDHKFELTNTDTAYLYSDDWNRASAQVSYKTGFTAFNFL